MSKHVKHVPKHRGAPSRPAVVEQPRKVLRSTVVLSSVAVAATGIVVSGGVAGAGPAAVTAAAGETVPGGTTPVDGEATGATETAEPVEVEQTPDAKLAAAAAAATGQRTTISRSADRRAEEDPVKEAALAEPEQGEVAAVTDSVDLAQADPRTIASTLLGEFGYGQDQFGCLDSLYTRESGWNVSADNPSSSAYGIPQALPGEKMASAGADWATNPVTQIRWGLGYIGDVYGSPCGAWAHSQSYGWY